MFNSKKLKTVILSLTIIMIVCFTSSFLIFGISIKNMNINNLNLNPNFYNIYNEIFNNSNYKYHDVNEEQIFSLDNINLISINTTSYEVTMIPYDENELKVKLSSNIQTNNNFNESQLKINKDQNKINIETYKIPNNFFFNMNNGKLDIYIPKTYNKSLDISTISGDGYIKNLNLSSLNFNSTSGSLTLKDMEMNNFIFQSTSSDLDATNIILKDNNNKFNSISGELNLNNVRGNLSFNTTSGNISCDKLLGDINGGTISGDIDIKISKDVGIKVDLKTVSGDIDVFPPIKVLEKSKKKLQGTIGDNAKHNLNISTTSGNISMYE
ncbi:MULTISPECIES: DUF4097 family beta strand repeat-containing protein [unclassified Clostridium]|uniref:DUF4097 family beta strand repeat-containing protein n=1 Tax=unclassified Clostridium TaxID=2614128 RepID=UPI0025BEEF43|nr:MULTISPECIES: DUF4097 family beta strand repeat-containing protein [unclassified Clostridium]